MEEIKRSYAWREAVELATDLVRICEEFSDAERNVLVWHLRQAVVDIPAQVAADLQAGRTASLEPVIKLGAELELVHRIYPAIDTGEAPELLAKLMGRMQSDRFAEQEPDLETEVGTEPAEAEESDAETVEQPNTVTVVPTMDGVSNGTVIGVADPRQSRRQ